MLLPSKKIRLPYEKAAPLSSCWLGLPVVHDARPRGVHLCGGDPIDVMVMGRMPVQPGAVIATRPIGVLELEDEAGGDEKILAVPIRKITQLYDRVKSWQDVPEIDLKRIQHFFEHYKDLEPEKWTRVGNWRDADIAYQLINEAIERAR